MRAFPRDRRARGALAAVVLLLLLLDGWSFGPGGSSAPAAPIGTTHPTDSETPAAATSATMRGPSSLGTPPPAFPNSQDWPTYEHDAERTGVASNETILSPRDAANLSVVASVTVPVNASVPGSQASIAGSIAVAGGYVYAGSWNGALYEFDASNLTVVWSIQLTNPRLPGAATNVSRCWRMGGIGSTPTVLTREVGGVPENTVIVAAGTGIYAINATLAPGHRVPSVLWFTNLTNQSFVPAGAKNWGYADLWGTPLVEGGFVYMGVASACDQRFVQGQVFQIPINGSGRYHPPAHFFNVTGYTGSTGDVAGGVWSAPTIDPSTGTLWVTDGNENGTWAGCGSQPYVRAILGLNASNVSELRSVFQTPEPTCYDPTGIGPDHDYGAGATIFRTSDGTSLVGAANKDGTFFVVNATTGTAAWNCSIGATLFTPLSPATWDGRTLFVAGDGLSGQTSGEIFAITPEDSSCSGLRPLAPTEGGVPLGGLTYANGLLVVAYDAGTGAGGGVLAVYNASSGQVLHYTNESSSINGEPIVADGRIFFGVGNAYTADVGTIVELGVPLAVHPTATPVNGSGSVFRFAAGVSGGMPGFSYSWSFGDGTLAASVATPLHEFAVSGSLTVNLTVTDFDGSSVRHSLLVTIANPVEGSASRNPVDVGVTTWLNFSLPEPVPVLVTWTGAPAGCPVESSVPSDPCVPQSTGRYAPMAIWSAGNGDSGAVRFLPLMVDSALAMTPEFPSQVAPGVAFPFGATLTGGTPPYHVEWAFGATQYSEANGSATLDTAGVYPTEITATDAGGGEVVETGSVTAVSPLNATPTALPVVGEVGSAMTLSVSLSGGLPPITVIWTGLPPGCPSRSTLNLTCVPDQPGAYRVTVNISDALGENTSSGLVAEVTPRIAIAALGWSNTSTTCTGGLATVELGAQVTGGEPPYADRWSGPGVPPDANAPTLELSVPPGAPTEIQFEAVDGLGAVVRADLNVTSAYPPACAHPAGGAVPMWVPYFVAGLAVAAAAVLVAFGSRRGRNRAPVSPGRTS